MSVSIQNPLLVSGGLPPFSRIAPAHVVPAVETLVSDGRQRVAALLAMPRPFTWATLIQPMEDLQDRLNRAWSPVGHLHAVADTPQLREAYNACLPLLSAYANELGQNQALFDAYRSIAEGPEFAHLEPAQRKIIENALRDFRLAGVALPADEKRRFREITARLSECASTFEENVLDATQAWNKDITDADALSGLPESARALAADNASKNGVDGWRFGLDFPSYFPVITYADDRNWRRETYTAYTTRASDQGPHADRWDNSGLIEEVLALRHEQAHLLGYTNYAELALARRMARNTDEVMAFLADLVRRSRPIAVAELDELQIFARKQHGQGTLEAWDLAYYSEKLRQHKFGLSQEALRPYFPVPTVLGGLFEIVARLYGLEIQRIEDVDAWHPDVEFYCVRDAEGVLRGRFYLDLYARAHKRGGAWMDECIVRKRAADSLQTPVAYLNCNFTPPVADQPALLTHDDVTTLFHEFGHGLHHLLTRVDFASVAGINGVAWDAVELPSQIMENWCWEREAVALFSGHWETGAPLPGAMFEKLKAAKNFQSGMHMLRQLEFAMFDFRLHMEREPCKRERFHELLDTVRREVAVLVPPAFNRYAHSFSHIFGGGYAAGYYSYKWAERLSSDAFSKFEETGIFDRTTGIEFLRSVLEQGGSRDALELFVEFRGREPTADALLRHSGIVDATQALEGAA